MLCVFIRVHTHTHPHPHTLRVLCMSCLSSSMSSPSSPTPSSAASPSPPSLAGGDVLVKMKVKVWEVEMLGLLQFTIKTCKRTQITYTFRTTELNFTLQALKARKEVWWHLIFVYVCTVYYFYSNVYYVDSTYISSPLPRSSSNSSSLSCTMGSSSSRTLLLV